MLISIEFLVWVRYRAERAALDTARHGDDGVPRGGDGTGFGQKSRTENEHPNRK